MRWRGVIVATENSPVEKRTLRDRRKDVCLTVPPPNTSEKA